MRALAVDLSIEKTLLSGGDGNVAPGGAALFELVVTQRRAVGRRRRRRDGRASWAARARRRSSAPTQATCTSRPARRATCSCASTSPRQRCAGRRHSELRGGEPRRVSRDGRSDNGNVAGPAGNPWCATVTVGEYLPDADMVVTTKIFTNPPGVPGGGPLTFEITVRNDGPAPAEGVTLSDLFFGLDSITVLGMRDAAGWELDLLDRSDLQARQPDAGRPAGDVDPLRSAAAGRAPAQLRRTAYTGNVAVVTADNPDPDLNPLSNLVYVAVPIDPQVDLSIEKTLLTGGDGNVAPGGSAIFELVVRNDGPSDADGAVVTDAILSGPGAR